MRPATAARRRRVSATTPTGDRRPAASGHEGNGLTRSRQDVGRAASPSSATWPSPSTTRRRRAAARRPIMARFSAVDRRPASRRAPSARPGSTSCWPTSAPTRPGGRDRLLLRRHDVARAGRAAAPTSPRRRLPLRPDDHAARRTRTTSASVLVCIGDARTHSSRPGIAPAFEQAMRSAGADGVMNLYGGAVHSVTNPAVRRAPTRRSATTRTADARCVIAPCSTVRRGRSEPTDPCRRILVARATGSGRRRGSSAARRYVRAMRTRLTELLDIEHPVMLAGMGGVSYHQLVAAVSEAGGIGTLGASTMGDGLADEMAKVRELTAKPFGVDLLTAMPGQVDAGHPGRDHGRGAHLRRRPRRAAGGGRRPARRQRPRRLDVRQGAPRRQRRRQRVRLRRRPGHRGRRPHRHRGDDGARARRSSTPSASGSRSSPPAGSSTGAASPPP